MARAWQSNTRCALSFRLRSIVTASTCSELLMSKEIKLSVAKCRLLGLSGLTVPVASYLTSTTHSAHVGGGGGIGSSMPHGHAHYCHTTTTALILWCLTRGRVHGFCLPLLLLPVFPFHELLATLHLLIFKAVIHRKGLQKAQ